MSTPEYSRNARKTAYKALWIIPLHIKHPGIAIPVENLEVSQQFSPSYKKENVYGRMDPIATYAHTSRTMRINFSCQAHHYFDDMDGVIDNIQTINEVTQMLYPAYEKVGEQGKIDGQALLKAPPFFRIKYGQYFGSYSSTGEDTGDGLTGFITGFSHGLGKLARNMAYGGLGPKSTIRALPREIKVGFSFEVIHDKSVGWTSVGDKSVFSEDGYGPNFPYNTGVVSKGSAGSKKDGPGVPAGKAPEPKGTGKAAGGTTPKVATDQLVAPLSKTAAKARLKSKSTRSALEISK
jgi:hypothetical protein